jgi:ribosomal protein S27AE
VTSPIRVLRQIVLPNGKHRPRRALLLPDEPVEQTATVGGVLDEALLEDLLDSGEVVANESALCPSCERSTFHAMHRDGSRHCWTCSTVTVPGVAS